MVDSENLEKSYLSLVTKINNEISINEFMFNCGNIGNINHDNNINRPSKNLRDLEEEKEVAYQELILLFNDNVYW